MFQGMKGNEDKDRWLYDCAYFGLNTSVDANGIEFLPLEKPNPLLALAERDDSQLSLEHQRGRNTPTYRHTLGFPTMFLAVALLIPSAISPSGENSQRGGIFPPRLRKECRR